MVIHRLTGSKIKTLARRLSPRPRMNSALPSDTAEVKQRSDEFEANELRKILYEVARQRRSNGEIRNAIKIVLLGWNWRAYAGSDVTNAVLNEQIDGFIHRNKRFLEYLASSGHSLESLDFQKSIDGIQISERIVEGFNRLLAEEAISSTGASKAFHMLRSWEARCW